MLDYRKEEQKLFGNFEREKTKYVVKTVRVYKLDKIYFLLISPPLHLSVQSLYLYYQRAVIFMVDFHILCFIQLYGVLW